MYEGLFVSTATGTGGVRARRDACARRNACARCDGSARRGACTSAIG